MRFKAWGLTTFWLSFEHYNWPYHSWDKAVSEFWHWKVKVNIMVVVKGQGQIVSSVSNLHFFIPEIQLFQNLTLNKANLRDLIAATGLVISNWIQIVNFSTRVTVKFDGWPCKTIGHLFYATSSFVHHFVAIGEFKLELQSGNAQSGSNSTIFRAMRPWNLTHDLAKQ